MTRAQRQFHLFVWLVLTPTALVLLVAAVLARHGEQPGAVPAMSTSHRGAR